MKTLRPYQQQAIQECWQALKSNDSPVLLMASVGAGKSLMIAKILLSIEQAGKRALCLVNNSELVRNNCESYREEGGKASIYCAILHEKDCSQPVVFGSPQSVLNAIKKNEELANIKFNLIVVDEAHGINHLNENTSFMQILRHYKQEYPEMRVLGATGTNFRFDGQPIVGDNCLFKIQVGNITTSWLIENGYLVKPQFEIEPSLVLDFSRVKVKRNGQFDSKQLELVISENTRLTELICKQIVHVMEEKKRFGIIIFATSRKHAEEIVSHLPAYETALVLGDTIDRTEIFDRCRDGDIRYLVNINIVSTGVDIPGFDTIAYMRPTESLVLMVQTMGRVLRLAPNKDSALVLDFAGNIERHRDWDDPILKEAVAQTVDKDNPLVILCPACQTYNTEHARRCIGMPDDKRCDYYFEFRECPECSAQNDIAARSCHRCLRELIDPNAKLSLSRRQESVDVEVLGMKCHISGGSDRFTVRITYECKGQSGAIGYVVERFTPCNDRAARVFYGQFVKQHVEDAGRYYMHLGKRGVVYDMLSKAFCPSVLAIYRHGNDIKIRRKVF